MSCVLEIEDLPLQFLLLDKHVLLYASNELSIFARIAGTVALRLS